MQNLIMVRYGEIYLKGLNRPYFLRALVSRVRQAAKPFGGKVWLHDARVFVSDMQDVDACMDAVRRVFAFIPFARPSLWPRTILPPSARRRKA